MVSGARVESKYECEGMRSHRERVNDIFAQNPGNLGTQKTVPKFLGSRRELHSNFFLEQMERNKYKTEKIETFTQYQSVENVGLQMQIIIMDLLIKIEHTQTNYYLNESECLNFDKYN